MNNDYRFREIEIIQSLFIAFGYSMQYFKQKITPKLHFRRENAF